jgi:protein-S-isoprenylcysteine O-methyltransferase Ste14
MSVLLIGLYFLCWALLHSLLAGLGAKRLARRFFGPAADRWYRFGFVAAAVLTSVPGVFLFFRLPDRPLYSVGPPWRWVMVAGQAAALLLLAWVGRSTDPLDFIGLRQLLDGSRSYRRTLVTHGLYRYTRHPAYFTSMLVIWLKPTMSVNLLALFSFMTLYFILGTYHEERLLVHQFGAAYLEYRKKTPRIFPGIPFPP